MDLKTYRKQIRTLVSLIAEGALTPEEAEKSAAGTLLKAWQSAGYEPATAMGKHDCALYNARSDIRWVMEA